MGQNWIRGGWGVKNCRKSSDIIYVRSLIIHHISLHTVFPRIVSAETILFWQLNFHIVSALWKFFTSWIWIVAAEIWIVTTETIRRGKLFKGGNNSRKYGIWVCWTDRNAICQYFAYIRLYLALLLKFSSEISWLLWFDLFTSTT